MLNRRQTICCRPLRVFLAQAGPIPFRRVNVVKAIARVIFQVQGLFSGIVSVRACRLTRVYHALVADSDQSLVVHLRVPMYVVLFADLDLQH